MNDETAPAKVRLSEGLGPLPDYVYGRECGENEKVWTEAAMRMYASAEVAAERERINALLAVIREHWSKANGADSMSVSALDQIAEVIADGSYVCRA